MITQYIDDGDVFAWVDIILICGNMLQETNIVVHNLRRAHKKWTRMSQVLSGEGADAWTLGRIYVVVVQYIILYGLEMWLIKRALGGFWADLTTGWPAG